MDGWIKASGLGCASLDDTSHLVFFMTLFLAILTNIHMATGTWKSWDGGMKPFSLVRHCII